MSIRTGLIVTAAFACLSAGCASRAQAADPELRLPSFESLQRNATESVNVTIGPGPLSMASWVLQGSDNAEDRDLREVLQGLKSINVRSFKFEADYDRSIVESVRSQLSAPGWSRLAPRGTRDGARGCWGSEQQRSARRRGRRAGWRTDRRTGRRQ